MWVYPTTLRPSRFDSFQSPGHWPSRKPSFLGLSNSLRPKPHSQSRVSRLPLVFCARNQIYPPIQTPTFRCRLAPRLQKHLSNNLFGYLTVGHLLTINISPYFFGISFQIASVTNGIKGWSSLSPVSNTCRSTDKATVLSSPAFTCSMYTSATLCHMNS